MARPRLADLERTGLGCIAQARPRLGGGIEQPQRPSTLSIGVVRGPAMRDAQANRHRRIKDLSDVVRVQIGIGGHCPVMFVVIRPVSRGWPLFSQWHERHLPHNIPDRSVVRTDSQRQQPVMIVIRPWGQHASASSGLRDPCIRHLVSGGGRDPRSNGARPGQPSRPSPVTTLTASKPAAFNAARA
jgi:hypothetical protein